MQRHYSNKQKKENRHSIPVKNGVFCPLAGKQKLLFESEAKAGKYIAFNADTITAHGGYAPVRAYFCEACGGWHVTSRKHLAKRD